MNLHNQKTNQKTNIVKNCKGGDGLLLLDPAFDGVGLTSWASARTAAGFGVDSDHINSSVPANPSSNLVAGPQLLRTSLLGGTNVHV